MTVRIYALRGPFDSQADHGLAFYSCSTEAELPATTENVHDLAITEDTFTFWAWDGAGWVAISGGGGGGGGATNLEGLTDVDLTSPADRDALMYESSSGLWLNRPIETADLPAHSHTFDGLSDVDTSGVADQDVPIYDAGSSTWLVGPMTGGGGDTSRELIEEIVVGSGGAATIDFDPVPGTYSELELVVKVRHEAASDSNLRVRFNNDSGNNYEYEIDVGAGGSAAAARVASVSGGRVGGCDGTVANAWDIARAFIPFYADTDNYKVCHSLIMQKYSTGTLTTVGEIASWWLSTSAITRITLSAESGSDLAEGSKARLYGLA